MLHSGSSPSTAFDLLHPSVQRWIWEQNWTDLRDVQEAAVEPILAGEVDVVIAAATASGKTEAAFLPIVSRLVAEDSGSQQPGFRVLYISPLKALINDQYSRLDLFCERLGIPVFRWHGDVAGSRKAAALHNPSGVLLITPESLEALFVNQGPVVARLLAPLSYIVVDELHSYIGAERGAQLQSLLHRLDLALRRTTPRIALSATLGDMASAAEYLRPGRGDDVLLLASDADGQEIKLQIRGYTAAAPRLTRRQADTMEKAGQDVQLEDVVSRDKIDMSEHIYSVLHGSDNLIFANSRNYVELFADLLSRLCARNHIPNEFWPHHGSLAKGLREHAETMLKERSSPVSVVCTSTLEMGIDIGTMSSIAQLDSPPSVASLRQRLGRSGRRGEAAVLRIYVGEAEITDDTPPPDALRAELVQSIASVRLLLDRWYEPPAAGDLHLSTLVQQLLSLIAQHGGVRAAEAYSALCGPGPFAGLTKAKFGRLLRALGGLDLVSQAGDGTLLLGLKGERIANHYTFYAAFATPEEYRLTSQGRALGTLPIEYPLVEGGLLIFAGRRWRVLSVNSEQKVVDLAHSPGGRPPRFGGTVSPVHQRVRQEMLAVYTGTDAPQYLDAHARYMLDEARDNFERYELDKRSILPWGADSLLFLWTGDRETGTVATALAQRGLEVANEGLALAATGVSPEDLRRELDHLLRDGPPDALALAASVENKQSEKYDWTLKGELLDMAYAARSLDPNGAWQALWSAMSGRPG